MFLEIPELVKPAQRAELKRIADGAQFADGRITNPHLEAKNNLQIADQAAYRQSSELLIGALCGSPEFMNFAFPISMMPPMLVRYTETMHYGAHADAPFLKSGQMALRSDLSCTIFLNEPEAYDGGELTIWLGTERVSFKGAAGSAIVYPSDKLHEVEPVAGGERFVAITFIQSRVADPFKRELLYELKEVAELEGLKMDPANYARLQLIQNNLLRHWGDPD